MPILFDSAAEDVEAAHPLVTGDIGDDLVAAFEPWLTADLAMFLRKGVATMFAQVQLYALDTADGLYEGWERLFMADQAPLEALPYLAQIVGERMPVGISEAAQRLRISTRPTAKAGTLGAIIAAAQQTLTGTGTVAVREQDGDVDHLAMRTLSGETPSSTQVQSNVLSVMPADIVLNYAVFTGASLGDVQAGFATLGAITGTLGDVQTNLVGYTTYAR
jgi:hypothetical protein